MFFADLHIHSKFSRATSRDADLEHMALWAAKKGVRVLGTGDFTHPQWLAEIQEKLVPAEAGLFRLRDDLQREVRQQLPIACQDAADVRFVLEVEISTIYKKGDKTRKIHHLIYVPGLDEAQRLIDQLSRIGNLKSDGRPILGLDSRHLLEITLQSGDGCYLVPAHIWTPWFAALGSKSGFDSIDDCYGDLASHIFAVETGLSSDPAMNWRLSQLDRFTLVSNSDAHSPPKIGREACAFETDVDYFSIRRALETGEHYAGTVEFYPEEGKYHMDGHRKCGQRLSPSETREADGRCPACGKPLTVGVMNRVESLADRPDGYRPDNPMPFRNLVPLPEVISEIRGVGEKSKRVQGAYEDLINKVGPELFILNEVPLEDLKQTGTPIIAEAVARMRQGQVICEAGYDGEYGVIRLFERDELKQGEAVSLLFEVPDDAAIAGQPSSSRWTTGPEEKNPASEDADENRGVLSSTTNAAEPEIVIQFVPPPTPLQIDVGSSLTFNSRSAAPQLGDVSTSALLSLLDPDQRAAAEYVEGPLIIIAGPGTGKTRTLTHRIAHLVEQQGASPEACLAVTFSRRAAEEMQQRLMSLLPKAGAQVPVMTLHALGHRILEQHGAEVELPEPFRLASDLERNLLLQQQQKSLSQGQARKALKTLSRIKRGMEDATGDMVALAQNYEEMLRARGLIDFDDLIQLPLRLFKSCPEIAAHYQQRWEWICVDEFQDLDDGQYELVRELSRGRQQVCVIGDPDQSIYGFRGANPRVFERFSHDFSPARTIQLRQNYRSSQTIVAASLQAVQPASLIADRQLDAISTITELVEIQTSATDRAEAETVVHTIERLIGGSTFFSIDSGRTEGAASELSFSDFAVLYRTDAQADVLVEALERSGMPFQRKCHQALIDEPEILKLAQFVQAEMQRPAVAPPTGGLVTDLLKRAVDASWSDQSSAAALESLFSIADRCGDDVRRFFGRVGDGSGRRFVGRTGGPRILVDVARIQGVGVSGRVHCRV